MERSLYIVASSRINAGHRFFDEQQIFNKQRRRCLWFPELHLRTLCPMVPLCFVQHVDDYSAVDREALKQYYHESFSHITCKPLLNITTELLPITKQYLFFTANGLFLFEYTVLWPFMNVFLNNNYQALLN